MPTVQLGYGLLLILLFQTVNYASCNSFDDEVNLSGKEHAALQKFKEVVIPKIPSTSYIKNYLHDDLFFIRWLRARNLDVNSAAQMFMQHLKWREENDMDAPDVDNWNDTVAEYPVFTQQYDKVGRPVSEVWFGRWGIRQAVISGQLRYVTNLFSRVFEVDCRRLFAERAKGREVAQTVLIGDLDGFTLVTHGCPGCIPMYLAVGLVYENQYPGMLESLRFINMPPTFHTILGAVRPILTPSTRNAIKSYVNKEQWLPVLDETIDKDQRSIELGGTIDRRKQLQ